MSPRDVLIAAMLERLKETIQVHQGADWWVAELHFGGLAMIEQGGTQLEAMKTLLWRVRGAIIEAFDVLGACGVDVVRMVEGGQAS